MTRYDRLTHKPCAECLRVLPRETSYALRYLDDPYGVAANENKRRRNGGQTLVPGPKAKEADPVAYEARIAFIAQANTAAEALLVQPRCFECDQLRKQRQAFTNALRKRWPEAALSTRIDKGYRRVIQDGPLSPQEHAALVLEAGRRGIAVLTPQGALSVPQDDVAALKGAYALLTTNMRVGALGRDREDAVTLIRERAPKVDSKLGRWSEDVIDAALVREGLDRASDAYVRILGRYKKHHAKAAWALITHRKIDKDWVWGRYDEAFLHGVRKWNPLHKAALSSYIGNWVKRYLAPDRTRADRYLGVYKQDDGTWSKPAVSTSGMASTSAGVCDGVLESTFESHAVSYTAGGACTSANADASAIATAQARESDVREALSALTDVEHEIAMRVFANGEAQGHVAADLGMTRAELRVLMDDVAAKLRWRLSIGYRETE